MSKVSVLNVLLTASLMMSVGCAATAKRPTITAESNPTINAGRGEPTLDDRTRPTAWIYIDGHEGHFTEKDGHKLLQWIIDTPVSPTPTFRVEVYEPLLPPPIDFKCVLQTRETGNGERITYGIAANEGMFEVGREYLLVDPGLDFAIRDPESGEILSEIEPLAPGTYLIAAKLENRDLAIETASVTYFSVGEVE